VSLPISSTARVPLLLGCVLLLTGLLPADAAAPVFGSLSQLPGKRGCVQHSEPEWPQPCARGRGLRGATSVAVSPDGQHAYVASLDGLAAFARDRQTGALPQLSGEAGCVQGEENSLRDESCARARGDLFGEGSVTVSPDGRNAYSVHFGAVGVFARDPDTGALTQLPGAAGCLQASWPTCARARGLAAAGHLAVSNDGRNVYVAAPGSQAVAVFARDPATGALTQLPGRAGCVSNRRDEGCGRGRALDNAVQVAVSPDGRSVYVAGFEGLTVFARQEPDGALTQLSGRDGCLSRSVRGCARVRGLGREVMSVAVSRNGRDVYAGATTCPVDVCRGSVSLFRRNPTTGTLRRAGCASQRGEKACVKARRLGFAHSLALTADGRSAYAVGGTGIAAFARNRRTGALRQLPRRRGVVGGRGVSDTRAVAVSPDGRNVYVASLDYDAVAVFARR
jgi:DNA-binding beta-propeller fold protein YncE